MPGLTVEDGTGLATADALVSRSFANDYFAGRGAPAEWTALTDTDDGGRDAAIRYGTEWLCARYDWPGILLSPSQALAWPRVIGEWADVRKMAGYPMPMVGLYDVDGRLLDWPVKVVQRATCEAALAHAKAAVNAVALSGGEIGQATLGPIAVTFLGAGMMPENDYSFIDSMLARIAAPLGAGVSMPVLRG